MRVYIVGCLLQSETRRSSGPHRKNNRLFSATCIAHGHTLVTIGAHDFERIPGLALEVWR